MLLLNEFLIASGNLGIRNPPTVYPLPKCIVTYIKHCLDFIGGIYWLTPINTLYPVLEILNLDFPQQGDCRRNHRLF